MKTLVLTTLLLVSLTACSNSDPSGKQTQVVSMKMLNSLIDRQLLVQKAVKLNLDRTPGVMQLVDAARAQIYAQAYLARKISTLGAATDKETQQFMADHSEVFSQRKVFTTADIIFANDPAKVELSQLQTSVNNAEELKSWLTKNNIPFEIAEETIPTKALPKEVLTMAGQLKVGDLLFMNDEIKVVARSIANIAEVPLSQQQAEGMATKAVNERKRQQLILDEVQRLKKMAQIEILDPNLKSETLASTVKASPASTSDKVNNLDHGLKGL